jgi:hypothetical protein
MTAAIHCNPNPLEAGTKNRRTTNRSGPKKLHAIFQDLSNILV